MSNQPQLCRQLNALLADGAFERNMAGRLGRDPGEFPGIKETLTQAALDSFVEAFARDENIAEYIRTIVAGEEGVNKFWDSFALLVLAYGMARGTLAINEHYGQHDATSSTKSMLADILREADPHGVVKRIDELAGASSTNALAFYAVAFILHKFPPLWSEFQAAAGEVSQL